MAEGSVHFLPGEDSGKAFGFPGPEGVNGFGDLPAQDLPIEEEDGLKGLILGGSGDMFIDGQVG